MSFRVSKFDAPSGYELNGVEIDHREEIVRVFFQIRSDSNCESGREYVCLRLSLNCDQSGYEHCVADAKREYGVG